MEEVPAAGRPSRRSEELQVEEHSPLCPAGDQKAARSLPFQEEGLEEVHIDAAAVDAMGEARMATHSLDVQAVAQTEEHTAADSSPVHRDYSFCPTWSSLSGASTLRRLLEEKRR